MDRVAAVLVLGIGNPILGDDGVGWRVADAVRARLGVGDGPSSGPAPRVEVDCLAVGGVALMERLVGYDRVILVDAIHGSGDPPGTVRVRALEDIPDHTAGHLDSPHDAALLVALEAGRGIGDRLPAGILVVTVEVERVDTFGESLSPAVAAAVPLAIQAVLGSLRELG